MIATKKQIEEMEREEKVQGNTKFTLNSEVIKGIKTIVKGHKNNKDFPVLNYVKINVVNKDVIQVVYTDTNLIVDKMFVSKVHDIKNKSFLLPIALFSGIKNIKKTDSFMFQEINEKVMVFTRNNLKQIVENFDVKSFPKHENKKDKFETLETSQGYEYFQYDDLKILDNAILSTSKSESRPILQEVQIINNTVVSTDSHRLYKANSIFKAEKGLVVNPVLIKKAMEVCDKNMFLKLSHNDSLVKIEDDYTTKIYFRKSVGNFPDTSRLLPENFNYEFHIDKVDELFEFAKNIKGSNKLHVMKFELDVENSKIHLEVKDEVVNAEIDIPVRINQHDLDIFKMSFSYKYLLDALTQLDKKPVTMKIISSMRPFIFEKQSSNKEMALILPVRTY